MDELVSRIRVTLIEFPWDEYGLDFVSQACPDWAEDLAERIASEC